MSKEHYYLLVLDYGESILDMEFKCIEFESKEKAEESMRTVYNTTIKAIEEEEEGALDELKHYIKENSAYIEDFFLISVAKSEEEE